jgi:hypothetical protein
MGNISKKCAMIYVLAIFKGIQGIVQLVDGGDLAVQFYSLCLLSGLLLFGFLDTYGLNVDEGCTRVK